MNIALLCTVAKLIGLTMMGMATIGFAKQKDDVRYKDAFDEEDSMKVELIVQPPRKRRG